MRLRLQSSRFRRLGLRFAQVSTCRGDRISQEKWNGRSELDQRRRARDGPAQRVLIIEDNRDGAAMLAMCLDANGFETSLAHDGPSGLDAARRNRPGVVVCDIGLPGLDGYQVARTLRGEPGFDECLLVAVTGYEDEDALAEQAGFDRRITKPIDPEALSALITAHAVDGSVNRLGASGERGSTQAVVEEA